MQRAASCTVDVAHPDGNCVFIFVNRPNTKWIDYIRVDEKDPRNPDKAQTGKIGTKGLPIEAFSGPMSCVALKTPGAQPPSTEIRLYFVQGNQLTEAVHACAGPKSDLKGGWTIPDKTTTDTLSITKSLSINSKAIDQSSYMSCGKTLPDHLPYVIWQSSGQVASTQYASIVKMNGRNAMIQQPLPVELTPPS